MTSNQGETSRNFFLVVGECIAESTLQTSNAYERRQSDTTTASFLNLPYIIATIEIDLRGEGHNMLLSERQLFENSLAKI